MALGARAGDVYLDGHFRLASNFGREMTSKVQTPAMRAGEEASKHFGRKFAAGLAISAVVIGAGLYKATKLAARGIKATTDAASALNEQVNKSNAIFGKTSREVQRWAKGAANAFGLSRTEALSNAAAFGDMFLQLKIGERPATNMSKKMVELAADLASFNDADISQVLQAQSAAFRGEYDSLQRFIPNINAARVQQVALNQTHKASAKDLTAAEKALATYTIILNDSRRAHGDYAKTLGTSVANQNRKAKAQWEDLKVTLGQGFLPAQLAVTKAFTTKLMPALSVFVRELMPGVTATATAFAASFTRAIPPAGQLADTAKRLGERLEVLGPELGAKVGAGIGKLFDLLQQLGPELRNTNVQASDLGPTLRLSGALFGFLADHADTLAKHLPLLVTGFLAYKAAQAAANVAQAAHVVLLPAQITGNFALARSNRALAASMGERAAATTTVVGAERTLVASTTAATVATTAAAQGQGIVAASLSPVIAKLAALSLGLYAVVTAYRVVRTESQHLSRDTDTTSDAVNRYGLAVGLSVAHTKRLQDQLSPTEVAQRRLAAAMYSGADAARQQKQAVDALQGALASEETAELDLRQAKVTVASAQARLTELTKGGRKGSLEYEQAQIDLKRAQIDLKAKTDAYKEAQRRAAAATGGAMRAAQQIRQPLARVGTTSAASATDVRGMQQAINRLHGKVIDVHARAAVEIARSTRMYLRAANVPGFRARGGLTRLGETAIVGEEGPELVQFRSPSYVYTAAETRRILGRGMAAGGPVGDLGRWDTKVITATERIGERFAARLAASIGKGLSAAIKRAIPDIGVGGALGQWIAQAIKITGVSPAWGPALARRARFESGGNPRAINLWDSNAAAGIPSMGLMQTIGPTFNAYAWDGLRDIWNPVHNLVAAIRYILARYGSIFAIDPPVGGYDNGGWLMPGATLAVNRTGRPERVLPPGGGVVELGPDTIKAIARELAKVIPTRVAVDDIHTALRRKQGRYGGMSLGLS